MSIGMLFAFAATCVVLGLTPGPNMALIMANTLRSGLRAGLITVAGTVCGLSILAAIATVGMTSIMVFMAAWFDVVRWAGALYLIFLGVRQLIVYFRRQDSVVVVPEPAAHSCFLQGLLVSLSNPKVLLFLGALLPQFITPDGPVGVQLTALAAIFVVVLMLVDIGYTLAIARAREMIDINRLRVLDGVAGVMLLAGGLVLATTRRP